MSSPESSEEMSSAHGLRLRDIEEWAMKQWAAKEEEAVRVKAEKLKKMKTMMNVITQSSIS